MRIEPHGGRWEVHADQGGGWWLCVAEHDSLVDAWADACRGGAD